MAVNSDTFSYTFPSYSVTSLTIVRFDNPPTVSNEISDVTADEDASAMTIDLGNVFTDLDNDGALISKSVHSNSNTALVTANITDNTLILDFISNQNGTATVVIRGTSNSKATDDSFTVTVNAIDDPPIVANPISDVTVDDAVYSKTIDLTNVFVDIDNDDALISKSIHSNSNPDLVTLSVVGNTLHLSFEGNEYGTAEIHVQGTSNGVSLYDEFVVNRKVNLANAVVILKLLSDSEMSDHDVDYLKKCDFSKNGRIDLEDALYVLWIVSTANMPFQ